MNQKAEKIVLAVAFVLAGTAYSGVKRHVHFQEEAMINTVLRDVDPDLRESVYRAARNENCNVVRPEFLKPCKDAQTAYQKDFALYPFLH